MYGVLVLGNFWHWSGGFGQYLSWVNNKSIPYPSFNGGLSWGIYMDYVYKFYGNSKAKKIYWDVVETIVARKNSITNELYIDDPTIMSWQLANEPKCGFRKMPYRNWIRKTAQLIKKLDPNHLISTGSEGIESESLFGNRRRNFIKNHSKYIDYLTVHVWIQNWMWYNPHKPNSLQPAQAKAIKYLDKHVEIAQELNMPLVLEEFGIARDKESYEASSTVEQRDSYYRFIFEYVAKNVKERSPLQACNFWAWGGIGRPRVPRSVWTAGDDLIGDPAHEFQGWYSVYDTDTTTHVIVKEFNDKLK
jgi:mannan endo-1,4-beta-mannosidase